MTSIQSKTTKPQLNNSSTMKSTVTVQFQPQSSKIIQDTQQDIDEDNQFYQANAEIYIIDEGDGDGDDQIDEEEEGDQVGELPQSYAPPRARTQRKSLCIGGLRRVSDATLPEGWTSVQLNGVTFYVNEATMQSTKIKPNQLGQIQPITDDDDYTSQW
jgi:hypothetical protein